jgi:hypothetical protein
MEGGCAKDGREGSHLDGNGRAFVETGIDLVAYLVMMNLGPGGFRITL